jgi:hypothetical protein
MALINVVQSADVHRSAVTFGGWTTGVSPSPRASAWPSGSEPISAIASAASVSAAQAFAYIAAVHR